jgi:VWFA-related protein
MRRKISFLLFVCASLILVAPAAFSQLEEEVRVDLIEVWVKVTDNNNQVVSDLAKNDFKILIDGKEAEVRCFDKAFNHPEDFISEENPFEPNPNAPKRDFVFFFDMLNTPATSVDYLKGQINNFLDSAFTPNDRGMIFALLPNVHLGVVQQMTSNKQALQAVINKMNGNPALEARIRQNEKQVLDILTFGGDPSYQAGGGESVATIGGPAGGLQARSPDMVRQARSLARSFAAQDENLSRLTMDSFTSIASYLSGTPFDGRLVMIYVSQGFSMRPGQNYFEIIDRAIDRHSPEDTEDLVFRDRPQMNSDFENQFRKSIGLLNRLNVTIYSVDAGGLVANNRGADRDAQQVTLGYNTVSYSKELQDSLQLLAEETGGMAFTGSQNYPKILSTVASDINQQYWLCAKLPGKEKNGSYHTIQVKVDRPGLHVRHRKGYIE